MPINDSLYLPRPPAPNGRVLVGQSVTRKDLKNTEELLATIGEINRKLSYPEIETDTIENTTHKECLRRKNRCHIIFDHMQGYYGISSLESLSQGKSVIAGLDEWNIICIKEFTGADELPWVIARNQDQLEDKLDKLIPDGDLRNNIGMKSRRFMENYWTETHALKVLFRAYETL